MNESVDIKTGEVIPETAIAKVSDIGSLVKESDKPVYQAMSQLDSLNWRDLKPNQMAVLLMQRPMAVSGGGTMFLNFRQALYFAVRAYELGLSPFSSCIWFDPNRFSVNLTLEGKRELARLRGIDLGPPSFEEVSRDWSAVGGASTNVEVIKKLGFPKDAGVKCRIRVGDPKHQEYCEYTAWLSEWMQPSSPVWKNKPMHMLSIRANEKAISLTLGTGASAMPDEKELE